MCTYWRVLYQTMLSSRIMHHSPSLYQRHNLPVQKDNGLSIRMNLGKHLQFVWLCAFSIKTGTRCIMRLDEVSFEMHKERHTTRDSLCRRIIRLLPVFILKMHTRLTTNVCPSLSGWIMHLEYKTSHCFFIIFLLVEIQVNLFIRTDGRCSYSL